MVTDEHADLQPYMAVLTRMQGLSFASTLSQPGWFELARVLKETAAGKTKADRVAYAARVVDAFLKTPRTDDNGRLITTIPAPIELREFAKAMPSTVPAGPLPGPCGNCASGDWVIVERGVHTGADRCDCKRGRALAARDEVARAEQAAARARVGYRDRRSGGIGAE